MHKAKREALLWINQCNKKYIKCFGAWNDEEKS